MPQSTKATYCADRSSQIATLVERQTRYVMLVKVTSKDAETFANALIKNARKLPQELYKSLTWDRGIEMCPGKPDDVARAREPRAFLLHPGVFARREILDDQVVGSHFN